MRYSEWLRANQPETPEGYLFYYMDETVGEPDEGEPHVEFVYLPKIRTIHLDGGQNTKSVKVALPEPLIYMPIPPWIDDEYYSPLEFASEAISQIAAWAAGEVAGIRELLGGAE